MIARVLHRTRGRGARRRPALGALAMAAVLASAACRDTPTPAEPGVGPPAPAFQLAEVSQDPTPDQMAVAQAVPGFGGYFLDGSGMPAVYLTDPARRPEAEQALAAFLESRGFTAADLRVLQADYDYLQLDAWYREAWPVALAVEGAVFSDLDEGSNRLRFGAADAGAVAAVAAALAVLDVPGEAIIVEETQPIVQVVTLRDRVRPVHGGYQIQFFATPASPLIFNCTLGFNAIPVVEGTSSFIVNSHCSNVQGGSETPTDYYQPGRVAIIPDPDNLIGVEVDDPHYWISPDCPVPGFMCRFSDAARAEYFEGVPLELGRIARPAARDPSLGTLEVDDKKPTFRIVDKQPHSVMGEEANKVGRTTGWTFGPVIATCVNSIVLGAEKPIIQLCQSRVRAGVAGGDSGSPVFSLRSLGSGRATLLGILWGSNVEETEFVFSPMFGIERELGLLQVH